MENAAFERDESRGCCSPGGASAGGGSSTVEMSEVSAAAAGEGAVAAGPPSPTPTPSPTASPAPPLLSINSNGTVTCSEHCQSLHLQHQKYYQEKGEAPAPESPWHHLKTVFLVGTLVFLALWVLIYTLLSQFAVL